MKPKPFAALNHLTVPVAIVSPWRCRETLRHRPRDHRATITTRYLGCLERAPARERNSQGRPKHRLRVRLDAIVPLLSRISAVAWQAAEGTIADPGALGFINHIQSRLGFRTAE